MRSLNSVDGLLEALDVRLGVGEERVEQVGELGGLGQVGMRKTSRPFWNRTAWRVSSKIVLVSG